MRQARIEQQYHGYRYGHELLATSTRLTRADQQIVDRISDLSGPIAPGEIFQPYLTAYPLPSDSYYVFSRTWPDLQAKRAGCVLTHTLLVPMAEWLSETQPAALLKYLAPVEVGAVTLPTISGSLFPVELPPIDERRGYDLVEALFLEERSAIVIFDTEDAELIALRLLTSLWPKRRRDFSFCTFAAGPRTIDDGNPFSLLFAPKSARSRFAAWPARRVDTKAGGTSARHQWTGLLAHRIFTHTNPSLLELDSLGALNADNGDHEGALRLSLLWSDLVARSQQSVMAVLGMLDILATQPLDIPDVGKRLTPTILRSIRTVITDLSTSEAWNFLFVLLGKPAIHPLQSEVSAALRQSATQLTKSSFSFALDFLRSNSPVPQILAAGVGDGLALLPQSDLWMAMEGFGILELQQVIPASRKFLAAAIDATIDQRSARWVDDLALVFFRADSVNKKRFRSAAIPRLKRECHIPYLEALIAEAEIAVVIDAVALLWKNGRLKNSVFDEVFYRTTTDSNARHTFLKAVSSLSDESELDRFIGRVLRLQEQDIQWLFLESGLPSSRMGRIAAAAIVGSSCEDVRDLSNSPIARKLVVDGLKLEPQKFAEALACVLRHADFDIEQSILIAESLRAWLSDDLVAGLARALLPRGMKELSYSSEANASLEDALNRHISLLSTEELVDIVVAPGASGDRVSANIVFLGRISESQIGFVLAAIDVLSARIVYSRAELTDDALNVWSELLLRSETTAAQAHDRAVNFAFHYALSQTNRQVTTLIAASFSGVYMRLLNSYEAPNLLTLFFFHSPDPSRAVLTDLVNAFMRSSWPPADLLVISTQVGAAKDVVDELECTTKGRRYLEEIVADLHRLPQSVRERISKVLRSLKILPKMTKK